jgi:hypothetical protein
MRENCPNTAVFHKKNQNNSIIKKQTEEKNIKTHAHACTQTIEQLTYKRNSFVSENSC